MKKVIIIALVLAASFGVQSAYSQVHVDVGINERAYPGYTYYEYPAWHGHYRDRAYYSHYHARFEREHRSYIRNRKFDHDRWEREHHH